MNDENDTDPPTSMEDITAACQVRLHNCHVCIKTRIKYFKIMQLYSTETGTTVLLSSVSINFLLDIKILMEILNDNAFVSNNVVKINKKGIT